MDVETTKGAPRSRPETHIPPGITDMSNNFRVCSVYCLSSKCQPLQSFHNLWEVFSKYVNNVGFHQTVSDGVQSKTIQRAFFSWFAQKSHVTFSTNQLERIFPFRVSLAAQTFSASWLAHLIVNVCHTTTLQWKPLRLVSIGDISRKSIRNQRRLRLASVLFTRLSSTRHIFCVRIAWVFRLRQILRF